MRNFIRDYSITSLLCIAIAATLLAWGFRLIAIDAIVQLAEMNTTALAQTALDPIRTEVADYLATVESYTPDQAQRHALPPSLDQSLAILLKIERIAKIKLYNRNGLIVFSSHHDQIGGDASKNPGFTTAIAGQVRTKFIYRDAFNTFDAITEDDNLVQTYVPVRLHATGPVLGVFEMYVDVNAMVNHAERLEVETAAGTALIMGLLYATLILIVRRVTAITVSQQQTIRERTAMLEALSAQMLRTEESERKRIAGELHEGLAQSLAAIKLQAEGSRKQNGKEDRGSVEEPMLPVLQQAIERVRTLASELRPPSLDELGLLPTVATLCREFESTNPAVRLTNATTLTETTIPPPLKIVVYRSIEAALKAITQHRKATWVRLALSVQNHDVHLVIDDNAVVAGPDSPPGTNAEVQSRFRVVEERTILSGGTFVAMRNSLGGTRMRASWPFKA